MRKLAAATALLVLGGVASADGLTTRFGLTGAIVDQGAPGKFEAGPMVAVGLRGGPFVGEVEWADLSFFEPDTTSNGVQRVGVALRADVLRRYATHCMFRYACTRGSSLWVDAGVAERFGQWLLDAHDIAPAQSREPEAHVSLGIELDNQIRPMRNGWQLGVRFAVSPRGVGNGMSCRSGSDCATFGAATTAIDKGGYDDSLLVEWTFLFGG
ncbi:MAG TPA: hypothetical protein VGG74_15395 [Kofleriaceae bacterium]|jgi:hypothetical protein